jgi:hypothetical protein
VEEPPQGDILGIKSLADGQLAASSATIYTVPAGKAATLQFLSLANTSGATTETVLVHISLVGGTSRRIARFSLAPNEFARAIDDTDHINLSAGDQVLGETTNASTVDYILTGSEE